MLGLFVSLIRHLYIHFMHMCVSVSNYPTPGDHIPALPVGWTPSGSSGGGSPVGGDWPVVLGGDGGPAVPHACAEHVRQTLLQVQVKRAWRQSQQ